MIRSNCVRDRPLGSIIVCAQEVPRSELDVTIHQILQDSEGKAEKQTTKERYSKHHLRLWRRGPQGRQRLRNEARSEHRRGLLSRSLQPAQHVTKIIISAFG